MDDVQAVGVIQSAGEPACQLQDLFDRRLFARNLRPQRRAIDKFGDDVENTAVLVLRQEPIFNQRRVRKLREGVRLTTEHQDDLGVFRQVREDDLDGDALARGHVATCEHLAHATGRNGRLDLENVVQDRSGPYDLVNSMLGFPTGRLGAALPGATRLHNPRLGQVRPVASGDRFANARIVGHPFRSLDRDSQSTEFSKARHKGLGNHSVLRARFLAWGVADGLCHPRQYGAPRLQLISLGGL